MIHKKTDIQKSKIMRKMLNTLEVFTKMYSVLKEFYLTYFKKYLNFVFPLIKIS